MRVEAAFLRKAAAFLRKAAFLRACAVRNEAYQHREETRRRGGEVLTKVMSYGVRDDAAFDAAFDEAVAHEQELACAATRFQQASAERDEMRVKAPIDPAG